MGSYGRAMEQVTGKGLEAAAALSGHQLKTQGLLLTTDAWQLKSWKEALAAG